MADGLVHEAIELVLCQQNQQEVIPGRVGGGRRFARATISWPFATQFMALNQESLPPLINATHFISVQKARESLEAVDKSADHIGGHPSVSVAFLSRFPANIQVYRGGRGRQRRHGMQAANGEK